MYRFLLRPNEVSTDHLESTVSQLKNYQATKKFKAAVRVVIAARRMSIGILKPGFNVQEETSSPEKVEINNGRGSSNAGDNKQRGVNAAGNIHNNSYQRIGSNPSETVSSKQKDNNVINNKNKNNRGDSILPDNNNNNSKRRGSNASTSGKRKGSNATSGNESVTKHLTSVSKGEGGRKPELLAV